MEDKTKYDDRIVDPKLDYSRVGVNNLTKEVEEQTGSKGASTSAQQVKGGVVPNANAKRTDARGKMIEERLEQVSVQNKVPSQNENTDVKGGAESSAPSHVDMFRKEFLQRKEDEDALKKRQRRAAIASAIGDGLTALSNVFFATRGAPSMYSGERTLSEGSRVRYDRLMQDLKANNKEYLSGLQRAQELDWRKAVQAKADARAAEKEVRDKEVFDHNKIMFGHQERGAKAAADRAETIANNAQKREESIINKNNRVGTGKGGSGGGRKGEPKYSFDGQDFVSDDKLWNYLAGVAEDLGVPTRDYYTDKVRSSRDLKDAITAKRREQQKTQGKEKGKEKGRGY